MPHGLKSHPDRLDDPDAGRRSAAIAVAGALGARDPRVQQHVLSAVWGANPDIALVAIQALPLVSESEDAAIKEIHLLLLASSYVEGPPTDALRVRGDQLRVAAITRLGNLRASEAAPLLRRIAKQTPDWMANNAARAIEQAEDAPDPRREDLAKRLRAGSSIERSIAALQMMCLEGIEPDAGALEAALRGGDERSRLLAAAAPVHLVRPPPQVAVDVLRKGLETETTWARRVALMASAHLGERGGATHADGDTDPRTR